MSNTGRVPDRDPPESGIDERSTLTEFLDYLRQSFAAKLAGFDDDAAHESHLPSGTSLYWLGVHMAAVEINQFQRVLAGRDDEALVPPPPPNPHEDRMSEVRRRYEAACAESRLILTEFDDLATLGRGVGRRSSERRTVRWVLVHMIEETARHAGHLDILREELDGVVGR